MTDGEITLAKSVFKSTIDFEKVEICNERWAFFQPSDTVMAPRGNIHYPPKHKGYSSDISTLNVHYRALLIHELTHIWQYQKGVNVVFKGTYQRTYKYLPIDKKTKFSDLGIEQQGDLVRDYYYLTQGMRTKVLPQIDVYLTVIPWLAVPSAGKDTGKPKSK